jgi:predicted DNA-binding antitoxin AbrB/MazE fold protein
LNAAYKKVIPLQVDAVYVNGVLRPLQPLELKEHERVLLSIVTTAAQSQSSLAVKFDERKRSRTAFNKPHRSTCVLCCCSDTSE